MNLAKVMIWGDLAGAALLEDGRVSFQYDPAFLGSQLALSPIMMPLSEQIYSFTQPFQAGLPGLLSDSLPDRFGNSLINSWLASQGLTSTDFTVIDRLCYIGSRGMGALEFKPEKGPRERKGRKIEISEMVELAALALNDKQGFESSLTDDQSVKDLLAIGTSAGGARAKAIIAWNPRTGEVRSGQVDAGPEFEYWLIKFDGVSDVREGDLGDADGYGLIEYAYHLMGVGAGVTMNPCRLHSENGRSHFMTKRFDRGPEGKIHMQSLSALAHLDFNVPGHSYEQAFLVGRQIGIPMDDLEQLLRRMIFNVVARNQDDHVKNIAFVMGRDGRWRLSPAFDVTYAFNPTGKWTARHQMTINGKTEQISVSDLDACAAAAAIRKGAVKDFLADVQEQVAQWMDYAEQAGVNEDTASKIGRTHRLNIEVS